MQNSSKRQRVLIFIMIIVGAFFLYTFLFKGDGKDAVLVSETPLLSRENIKGRELLQVLLSLNAINLDESVFSSNLFTSLEDFSITLPQSSTGRPNPFAPIGSDSAGSR